MSHGRRFCALIAAAGAPRCAAVALIGAAVLVASGCGTTRRALDTGNKFLEAKAAYAHSPRPNLPFAYERHFERGWRCGYLSVAKGRDTCPPAVPPEEYYGHQYQSPAGRQFVCVWYDGWRAGAAVAKSKGLDVAYRVPAIRNGCCDCRTACSVGGSGVLPLPESVRGSELGPPRLPPPPPTAPVRLPAVPAAAPAAEEIAPLPPAEAN